MTSLLDSLLGQAGFAWSATDLEAANSVLADAAVEPRDVIVLTDEEVVALDGLQHSQLVPTPWLDAQEIDRRLLGGMALRGLIARKMLSPAPNDRGDGTLKLTATREILGALMLRRTAQRIVRMERTTNAGSRWVFGYVHDGVKALIEDVDINGLHAFAITTTAGLASYLRDLSNPLDAPGSTGAATAYTADEFGALTEIPEAFAGSESASMISVASYGEEPHPGVVVYAGPETLGLLTRGADDSMDARAITDAELRGLLERLVAGQAG